MTTRPLLVSSLDLDVGDQNLSSLTPLDRTQQILDILIQYEPSTPLSLREQKVVAYKLMACASIPKCEIAHRGFKGYNGALSVHDFLAWIEKYPLSLTERAQIFLLAGLDPSISEIGPASVLRVVQPRTELSQRERQVVADNIPLCNSLSNLDDRTLALSPSELLDLLNKYQLEPTEIERIFQAVFLSIAPIAALRNLEPTQSLNPRQTAALKYQLFICSSIAGYESPDSRHSLSPSEFLDLLLRYELTTEQRFELFVAAGLPIEAVLVLSSLTPLKPLTEREQHTLDCRLFICQSIRALANPEQASCLTETEFLEFLDKYPLTAWQRAELMLLAEIPDPRPITGDIKRIHTGEIPRFFDACELRLVRADPMESLPLSDPARMEALVRQARRHTLEQNPNLTAFLSGFRDWVPDSELFIKKVATDVTLCTRLVLEHLMEKRGPEYGAQARDFILRGCLFLERWPQLRDAPYLVQSDVICSFVLYGICGFSPWELQHLLFPTGSYQTVLARAALAMAFVGVEAEIEIPPAGFAPSMYEKRAQSQAQRALILLQRQSKVAEQLAQLPISIQQACGLTALHIELYQAILRGDSLETGMLAQIPLRSEDYLQLHQLRTGLGHSRSRAACSKIVRRLALARLQADPVAQENWWEMVDSPDCLAYMSKSLRFFQEQIDPEQRARFFAESFSIAANPHITDIARFIATRIKQIFRIYDSVQTIERHVKQLFSIAELLCEHASPDTISSHPRTLNLSTLDNALKK